MTVFVCNCMKESGNSLPFCRVNVQIIAILQIFCIAKCLRSKEFYLEGNLHMRVGMELDYERPEYWTCVSGY